MLILTVYESLFNFEVQFCIMLPIFEKVSLADVTSSIKVFKREEDYFKSYWHYHPEMELTYIVKGEGFRYVGDSIEQFSSGDFVLLGKNIPHNWESLPRKEVTGAEALIIQFPEAIFSGYPEFNHFESLLNLSKLGISFSPKEHVLNKMREIFRNDNPLKLIKFFELFHSLSVENSKRSLSSERFSFSKYSHLESRINKAKSYIDSHIHGIKLSEISAEMKMTESYFCRWFKKSTGHTLIQYCNRLKVELVCRELVFTDKDISGIAYENGFENISHFNRVFKALKGISPKKYRQNNSFGGS